MEKSAKKAGKPGAPRALPARRPETVAGARIERRNIVLFAAGVGAVALGYLVLSLGGESLATILLVGGYLGLVPWAILAGGHDPGSAPHPPGRAAGE